MGKKQEKRGEIPENTMDEVICRRFAAGPHISQPLVPKSQWLTASPQGEAFVQHPTRFHNIKQGESFSQKASPLREKLSKIDSYESIFD